MSLEQILPAFFLQIRPLVPPITLRTPLEETVIKPESPGQLIKTRVPINLLLGPLKRTITLLSGMTPGHLAALPPGLSIKPLGILPESLAPTSQSLLGTPLLEIQIQPESQLTKVEHKLTVHGPLLILLILLDPLPDTKHYK